MGKYLICYGLFRYSSYIITLLYYYITDTPLGGETVLLGETNPPSIVTGLGMGVSAVGRLKSKPLLYYLLANNAQKCKCTLKKIGLGSV